MSFASQVLGTLIFRKNELKEIAESEELTFRGWFLLIISSLIAGSCISVYYLNDPDVNFNEFFTGLLITIFFCFFYGFDIAWTIVALKKGYSVKSFLTIDGLKGLRDPDFQRSIRLMGYSSIVLLFSGLLLLTGVEFYQGYISMITPLNYLIEIPFIILNLLNILPLPLSFHWFLIPLTFPYIMFLNPLEYPIVFFLVWQTIIFYYGYNISTEGNNLKGLILGFVIFNLFWTIVFIVAILTVIAIGAMFYGGGSCDCSGCGGTGKKTPKNKSPSNHQTVIKDR